MSTAVPYAAAAAPASPSPTAPTQGEPITPTPPVALLAGPAGPAGIGPLLAPSGASRPAVILAVDDDPDALAVLEVCLSMKGFEVVTASNGSQALRLVAQNRPDLIVADCIMPGLSGLELSRLLRSSPETRQIPLVMCSGTCLEAAERALVDRFITKPADIEELAALIDGLLGRSAA